MFLTLLFSLSNLSMIIFSSYTSWDIPLLCINVYGNQHLKSMGYSGLVPKLHILKYFLKYIRQLHTFNTLWSRLLLLLQDLPRCQTLPLAMHRSICLLDVFESCFLCMWGLKLCGFVKCFCWEIWVWLYSTCFCSFSVLPSMQSQAACDRTHRDSKTTEG